MKAHKAGYQVTAHAVGDKAVTIMVNAIEKALAACPRKDHRHRIEHCGITNPELIGRIAKLGIVPISNPLLHLHQRHGLQPLLWLPGGLHVRHEELSGRRDHHRHRPDAPGLRFPIP